VSARVFYRDDFMRITNLMATSALVGMMTFSGAAFAQGAKPAAAEAAEETIIVTGSRIAQPNLQSAAPVAVVTGNEIFETGSVSVGDLLNDLPQLRSTYSQQNSTRNLGNRGLNLLDLRGLDTPRTLVLVNGRRHVGSDVLLNATSVDINTIPSELIDRIDVLTGGASGVYGSDAIGGVVNFILKDNYQGIKLHGQAGISRYGDAGNQYLGALVGQNFADGRGNVTVDFEFAHTSRFFSSGRPNLKQNDTFVVTDTDPAGTPNGSDGVFDRTFFQDVRSATSSLGGQLGIAQSRATPGCGADYLGNPFTCAFLFQPDGSLTTQSGTRVGLGPNGNFSGGNGYSAREGQLQALTPDLKRFSVNLLAHFEISPAFVPFIEAKYVRSEAFGSQSGPFFNSSNGTIENSAVALGFSRERIRLDNPYLSTQARTLITQQILAAGVDPNSTATTPAALTAAQRTAIANGSFRLNFRRTFLDLGIRDEQFRRETYRVVAGVRGTFNDDWKYEISANYGEHKENNQIQNNVSRQRFLLANDTAVNGAGQIVCRSQIDPTAAGIDRGTPVDPAQLAADVAACVPLNPFGEGNISQAAKNYLSVKTTAVGKITQFDLMGFMSGDLSKWFELPGGPVAFALGGEYRRETLAYKLDDYTQRGYAFYNALLPIVAPAFEVKEAYGELRIPLLKDKPFFHELTFNGSGRVSSYNGKTGTVYSYGAEGVWSPVKDITFRAAYNRSVRAPTLSDLYFPQGQNFTAAPNDPCSDRNLATGSATRVANCTAAGRPAGYDYVYTSSLEIRSGGNPDLKAEKSDSYTFGGYIQPRWIPGLSISADYYDITVNNVIADIGTAQQILNLCYDSTTLNNPFCSLFQRAGAGGGPNGEIPFQVLSKSLLTAPANFARLKARGIDAELAYQRTFGWGKANLNVKWNHVIKNESYKDPTDPTFVNVINRELGDPEDQINLGASVKHGKVTFGYQMRWIGPMYLNTYEDYNSVNGLPPQNTDYAPIARYPGIFYHDLRLALDVTERFNLYFGVDNIADQKPPFGLTGIGAGSGIYDNRGRYMYAGVTAKF
jgi:outer membrane receptor protein involved in Fe transport